MSYDPEARRDTPLALKLKHRIARDGAVSVEDYMHACLYDPEHGYYVKRPAIGAGGDFITAPEISQIFGELIGLWSAVVWQQMGSPERIKLTELGPGRGTLLADALRAARVLPAFLAAVEVELVETNEVLIESQRQALGKAGVPLAWTERLELRHPAPTPTIIIGNEFLDTIPVGHHVLAADGWREQQVTLDAAGRLVFGIGTPCRDPVISDPASTNQVVPATGAIHEFRRSPTVLEDIAQRASQAPVASLLLDYGHLRSTFGDTLQAVRDHRFEHPLTSPGEADLTAQVDFHDIAARARSLGLAVDGPVTQAEFLGALGIVERASKLMATNPASAGSLEIGVARLISPTGMGGRFKAIGLRSQGLQPLPAFPVQAE